MTMLRQIEKRGLLRDKLCDMHTISKKDDVGGVLAAPRLFTSRELRGKRATYINRTS